MFPLLRGIIFSRGAGMLLLETRRR
ncbi:hypothetical protein [Bacillus phage CP-51]|uniref:Uncharacterized protein n=1 Tax=Bacillus phage CP-51 TaxID=1391188 RepID=A0A068EQF2_9CAUD|nr:hypothetical protein OZ73_gp162 [Bacillus phage CP-51]AID50597.1 hypothetical protein [Bacillus phage CP-51]